MSLGTIILIIVIALVVLLIFYTIGVYNKLIDAKNKVMDQWAQIDVQLKRRSDLIPNLVETVKGYTKHEESTLIEIVNARNMVNKATDINEEIDANDNLTKAIGKIFALAEAYPDLKANENYLSLQNDLKEIEEKISYARAFYNDTVLKYANAIQKFPSNIIAKIFNFKPISYLEAKKEEKEVPKVDFSK